MKPFFRTTAELKQLCRLGESSVDADLFIGEALLEFEVAAIDILGSDQWNTLKEAGTDPRCKLAEFKMVKAFLMKHMPTVFVESDVTAQQILEDEALTRESDPTSKIINDLIEEARGLLESAKENEPVSSVQGGVLGTTNEEYSTVWDMFEEGKNL